MKSLLLFFSCVFSLLTVAQINTIVRGPYLQQTGPNSSYICWKTNILSNSKVVYGTIKSNLSSISYINNLDTNHCNLISGLLPNTKYYYTVNQSSTQMCGDTFYFYTAPPFGSGQKVRFLALGDCGSGYIQQYNVKAAVNYYKKNNYINGILLLGDNAYDSGFYTEYQTGFFNPYKTNFILGNSCIYAAPGNHDYGNDYNLSVNHQIPYYEIFKTPQNAELGGVASYHKEFYSYNYANIHFISLDSYGIEQGMYHLWDSLGPQYQWLEQDLLQDKSMWKIVYFHHPPFTMGSHNSDTESDLVAIRKNIASLLEKYGVDLVINGHSHTYERSWLQKGHYDLETSFNKIAHTLDSSSARYDGTLNSCPYKKDTADNKGTVYVVAGESGKIGTPQANYPHDSKYFSETTKAGALFLEVEGNRLDAFYLEEDSLIHDQFTILKNANKNQTISAFINQSVSISASWNGTYLWNYNNSKLKTQTISFTGNNQYIVTDSLNCLADTFNIIIAGLNDNNVESNLKMYPNPVKDKIEIEYLNLNQNVEYVINGLNGNVILSSKTTFLNGKTEINLSQLHLSNSSYFLSLKFSEKTVTKPFFIDR
jgi:hypothetical protein